MKFICSILSFITISSASLAFAHNLPTNTTWKSDYISGKGKFTLYIVDNIDAAVTEDRNQCTFDFLGNVAACTLMYAPAVQGKLNVVQVPTERTTMLYRLENSTYEIVHNLKDANAGSLRLLKLNDHNQVIDSIRLWKEM